jgi:hypothetical protein
MVRKALSGRLGLHCRIGHTSGGGWLIGSCYNSGGSGGYLFQVAVGVSLAIENFSCSQDSGGGSLSSHVTA